jgi:3-methyladenine DNA glycosylase AlkC
MPEKLKDILFPREKVEYFAQILKEEHPAFDAGTFVTCVCDEKWPERELKEKMRHTTLCLHRFMPENFGQSVEILKALVAKVKGFEAIVLPDYVEVYGLEYWDISLPALGVLTKCGSSEFAIRPFLNKNLEGAMEWMSRWAGDDDFRVRRFASEECRPRLPWGAGVPKLKKTRR